LTDIEIVFHATIILFICRKVNELFCKMCTTGRKKLIQWRVERGE